MRRLLLLTDTAQQQRNGGEMVVQAKSSPKVSPQSSAKLSTGIYVRWKEAVLWVLLGPRPQSPLGTVAATLLQSNSKAGLGPRDNQSLQFAPFYVQACSKLTVQEDVERTSSKEKASFLRLLVLPCFGWHCWSLPQAPTGGQRNERTRVVCHVCFSLSRMRIDFQLRHSCLHLVVV